MMHCNLPHSMLQQSMMARLKHIRQQIEHISYNLVLLVR